MACLVGFHRASVARAGDGPAKSAPAKQTAATQPARVAPVQAKSQPSPAEIRQWVKDLDSDTFAARQTAAQMLFQAGKVAIGPVEQAATGKSLEVTMQAVDILRRLAQSADKPTHEAAKDALQRLAKGDNAAAAPAKEALAPPPAPPTTRPGIIRGFGGGFGGGGIQIIPGGRIAAGGIQVFRIQANANGANGNRSVDVSENGKRTHIEQDQNGIEVKVTEKVQGKDKTDTYKAKDEAELTKKFPQAEKLYKKYMNGNGIGNIQIQAQAMPLQIRPLLPPGFLPQPARPTAPATDAQKQAAGQIAEAQKRIAEATESLRKNVGTPPTAEDMKRALDQLDAAKKELEGARGKLGS